MSIASRLSNFFPAEDIQPLLQREDLFRCTRRDGHGKPYQVIYVDESDAWLQDDIEVYLENMLSDDYYTCEDYLQWNFYYYFVSDGAHTAKHKGQKQRVEQDESFARKIVLTPQEFMTRLSAVNSIGKTGVQLESGDLYNEWLDYLYEKELHFVYDEKQYPNYKAWVDQYVEGKPFDPPADDVQQRKTSRKVVNVGAVAHLSLNKFRPYPEQRQFNFGKVNLIFGPNASGKTSFFDAMELCFTGQARGAEGAVYQMDAMTSSHEPLGYPAEQGVYRQRDIAWYKNVNTRGHNLFNNFNKFNYYASDAAFLLQADDAQGKSQVESTITDIALGREINRLEERINEFCNRFQNRYDDLKKIQKEQLAELEVLQAREDAVRQEDHDPASYRKPVTDFLDTHKWLVETGEDEAFIVRLENAIRLLLDCLDKLSAEFPGDSALSKQSILGSLDTLRKTAGILADYEESQEKAQQDTRAAQQEMEALIRLIDAAEDLAPYFADPDIAQLAMLDDLISEADKELEKTEKAAALIPRLRVFISLQPENTGHKKFFEYQVETAQSKNDATEALNRAVAENERIRRGVEQLTAIVADIKRLGLDYLAADHEADHCPLCQQSYPHAELTRRITASAALLGDAENYTLQQKEITRLEKIIENCELVETQINQLESVIPLAFLDLADQMSLDELQQRLEADSLQLPQLRDAVSRLRTIKVRFDEQGLSFARFTAGKSTLEEWSKQTVGDGTVLARILQSLQEAQEKLDERLQKLRDDTEAITSKAEALYDRHNPNKQTLQRSIRNWQRYLELADQISSIIQLTDDKDLFSLRSEVQEISSLFSVYRTAWRDRGEQTRALKELSASVSDLKARKTINDHFLKNAKTGVDLLQFLLSEKNKRNYLLDFIARNKTELVDIFRLIHAPLEFSDISFDQQKISLLDASGKWHSINEVSTGQRTAIALSLFLSLNQKLTAGPNVILLDDPVTYVDDLNTLSFLDYLRELIENTDRQIFFATANADVAFLFEKKFAYLPEGQFCRFDFKRSF